MQLSDTLGFLIGHHSETGVHTPVWTLPSDAVTEFQTFGLQDVLHGRKSIGHLRCQSFRQLAIFVKTQ